MADVPSDFDAEAIIAASGADLRAGDTWYLVSVDWFGRFKNFFGLKSFAFDAFDRDTQSTPPEDNPHPGPIDNKPLLNESSDKLKSCLVDKFVFSIGLVPVKACD
jgi:hypothetical protein